MEKENRNAFTRHGDQQYYLSKILSKKYLLMNPNPEYTKQDEIKKLEILDIPNSKTCFITGENSKGVGDHLYEINGYYRRTNKRGINDKWNILPVCGVENKRYKKIKFTMPNGRLVNKDIGYEQLDVEEFNYMIESGDPELCKMADIFIKIIEWKSYVEKRNAKIYYEEPENFKNIRIKFKENYIIFWQNTINAINSI